MEKSNRKNVRKFSQEKGQIPDKNNPKNKKTKYKT